MFVYLFICVIQHRNWPLRPTILNAHSTNASLDGLCTRTHTNEAFSCWFCCYSFKSWLRQARQRVFRGMAGPCLKSLERTYRVQVYNVFFCFGKNAAERGLSQQLYLQVGRPCPWETCCTWHYCCARPALLMGGRGGSAVGAVVVAPGTSSSVGRVLGNRDVELRRN